MRWRVVGGPFMNVRAHDEVWPKIRDLPIGREDVDLTFERRLARENGWSLDYASRVVFEYRRFLLLLATSDEPLTPSDQVDQAWHLHLAYTESYWQDLCHGVLQKRLHHGPTRGGERENRKFERWYERTLSTYEQVFGEAAPADVWPPASERFRDAAHYQRVNRATHILLPWPRFLRGTVLQVAIALALSGVGAWILSARGADAAQILTAVCGFLLVFLIFGAVFGNIAGGKRPGAAGGAGGYGACGGCSSCGGGGCGGCGS